MLSPEDELQERSGVSDVPPDCANCGEPFMHHTSTGQCLIFSESLGRATEYEPLYASDILSAENEGL